MTSTSISCRISERLVTSVARQPTLSLCYDRIMVRTILKRVIAFTACGLFAGSSTTSPVFTSMVRLQR